MFSNECHVCESTSGGYWIAFVFFCLYVITISILGQEERESKAWYDFENYRKEILKDIEGTSLRIFYLLNHTIDINQSTREAHYLSSKYTIAIRVIIKIFFDRAYMVESPSSCCI